MPVVHRAFGLRFIIYVDDHPPAHVHIKDRGDAKVNILGQDGEPEIVRAVGMTRADQRRMVREIAEHRELLLRRWSEIHDRVD